MRKEDLDSSFFSRQRDEQDEAEESSDSHGEDPNRRWTHRPRPLGPSNVAWELGYAFGTAGLAAGTGSGGAAASVTSHSGVAGLDWEAMPEFALGIELGLDTLPDADYRHGRISLRLEYYRELPLGPNAARMAAAARLRADEDEDDERDARAYYLKHTDGYRPPARTPDPYRGRGRRKGDARTAAKPSPQGAAGGYDTTDDDDGDDEAAASLPGGRGGARGNAYPNLRAALVLDFDRHVRESPDFSALDQFTIGPDLNLAWNEATLFHLALSYTGYSTGADGFLKGLLLSPAQALLVPVPDVAGFQPRFLAFPQFQAEEGVTYDFNDVWTADFHLNQIFYALKGASPAFGFAPVINCSPWGAGSSWNFGLGGELVVGSAGTSALGLLNLSYLF